MITGEEGNRILGYWEVPDSLSNMNIHLPNCPMCEAHASQVEILHVGSYFRKMRCLECGCEEIEPLE